MTNCDQKTLREVVDLLYIMKMVDNKKYFANYLKIADEVRKDLFRHTIQIQSSVWMPLKAGNPYNYVDVPAGSDMIYSVGTTDHCNKIVPLYYNNTVNTIAKPTASCSCGCDCGGMCSSFNQAVVITKYKFTDNGIDYYEKDWIKLCKNGDILEYREIPTKKYLDLTGDSGDFNNDYNNDFSIGSGSFSNYEIVTEIQQQRVCAIAVKPCGCPVNTPENNKCITDHCSAYIRVGPCSFETCCEYELGGTNNNGYGEVKMSECGTRIYFIPNWRARKHGFPDYLLVNFRSTGKKVGQSALVPDFSTNAMLAGIDFFSKKFKSTVSQFDKKSAMIEYQRQQDLVVEDMNRISLHDLNQLQDTKIRW